MTLLDALLTGKVPSILIDVLLTGRVPSSLFPTYHEGVTEKSVYTLRTLRRSHRLRLGANALRLEARTR